MHDSSHGRFDMHIRVKINISIYQFIENYTYMREY